MAGLKISALPAAESALLTDVIPVDQLPGPVTYKETNAQILTLFKANGEALTRTNDTNVTMTLGGSPTTALLNATDLTLGWTGELAGTRGGTGVNNSTRTITIAGNLTTSGAFASTFTMTNTTNVTFPTSGTLATVGNTVSSIQGTANQVLVNATSGSPQTGAVTLTTPQDIGTSSTPQFTAVKTGSILDTNGNGAIVITATGSAVNQANITNATTLNAPTYGVSGTDPNISTIVASKGTGQISLFTGALTQPLAILSGTSSQHTTNFAMANTAASRTVTFPDTDGTILFAAGAGGLKSYQILTSGTAATYTRPAGITSILVEAVGGGGGGGGSQGGVSALGVGGGGGAGGYARLYVASAASTYTYTIGGGGGGGSAGITTGTSGSATTFSASSLSASGGIGGTGGSSISTTLSQIGGRGGIGGGGTNGDINMSGGYGGYGIAILTNGSSGGGGRSFYAPGAAPSAAQGTGNTASGHGGGGGGGLSTTTDQAGGPGSDGFIIVWEFA